MIGIPEFPRAQDVVLPILRSALPGVHVCSWIPDIDYRRYPVVGVRRMGGGRSQDSPGLMDNPLLELSVYGDVGLPETERLYMRALEALYEARARQVLTPAGHIVYVKEVMGQTQFQSHFQDTYRVQGLIQVGVRCPRKVKND